MKTLVALALGLSAVYAQAAGPSSEETTLQHLRRLSEEVRKLNIEVTALKLALHEARARDLDHQLRAAAFQQRQLDQVDSTVRQDLAEAETQLARGDLSTQERSALEEVRSSFLTEAPGNLRQEALALRQRELELRKQADEERAQTVALQQRLQALTQGTQPGK